MVVLQHKMPNRLLYSVSVKQNAAWFREISSRENDIVTGIIQRMENKNVYIDLGKAEAILTPNEQIPGEIYQYHDRMKPISWK